MQHTASPWFVDFSDVWLAYNDELLEQNQFAVEAIDLKVRKGEFIAIVGPSGCGKSTFMKLATGLKMPSMGKILIDQQPVTGPLKISGMAFQASSLLPWRTTVDNVLLPLEIVEPYRSSFKAKRKEYEERAPKLLQKVGLGGYEDKFPWQLSGGMQQRASICRALIHEPLVLHANVSLFNGTGWGSTTSSDTGWSNQITYTTPNFVGLKANIPYQFGEITTDTGKNNVGLNLLYATSPLGLTAFWERNEVTNPVPATLPGGATRTNWMLGGSYDAKVVKGFLTYGKSSSDLAGVASKATTSLGLSAPLGNGKVLAAWANTKVDAGDTRDTVTVGYDYTLSKRTDVYAMLMNDKITTFESDTSFGMGVRHRF